MTNDLIQRLRTCDPSDVELVTQLLGAAADELERLTQQLQQSCEDSRSDPEHGGCPIAERLANGKTDRSIPAVIGRLRFGDSDGDDHDIAAAEIERLQAADRIRDARVTKQRVYRGQKFAPNEERWFYTEGMAEQLGYTVTGVYDRVDDEPTAYPFPKCGCGPWGQCIVHLNEKLAAENRQAEPKAPRTISKDQADALERAFWDSVVVVDDERCWIKGCRKPKGHRGWCQAGPTL